MRQWKDLIPVCGLHMTQNYADGKDSNKNFDSYGHIVLIAGGIGISTQLARVSDLLIARAKGLCVARKISLIWCVKYSGKNPPSKPNNF